MLRVLNKESQICLYDDTIPPYSVALYGVEQKWSVSDAAGINAIMDKRSRTSVTTKKLATKFAKKWNRQHHRLLSKELIKGREYVINDSFIFYDGEGNIEVPILAVIKFTKKKGDYYYMNRKKLVEIVNGLRKD